ncbi:uncharacterized protein PAF06_014978 [Gastrophryne carolinensis]
MSRDPKFSSSEQVPFMEEWKARRERMRLRSTSSLLGSKSIEIQVQQEPDLQSHVRLSHSGQARNKDTGVVKAQTASIKIQSMDSAEIEAHEPVSSKTKEKTGTPQKKHRTQIEKRKLREKRRPTGVVNMFPSEDPDEKEEVKENAEFREQAVIQGESCHSSVHGVILQDQMGSEETWTNRAEAYSLGLSQDNSLKERQLWMEELQKAVRGKKEENLILTSQLNEKEGSLLDLQKEMKTLTQKMKNAEEENKSLKEENQMFLKMMGHLSS